MSKQKHVPLAWFGTFIVLFSSITIGTFFASIGSGFNVFLATGLALIAGGILFSIAFLAWFIILTEGGV